MARDRPSSVPLASMFRRIAAFFSNNDIGTSPSEPAEDYIGEVGFPNAS
jgi:hypothetical protein